MTVSKVALAAMTISCGSAFLVPSALDAQQPAAVQALAMSREERAAVQALAAAASGSDRAAQDAALAAARSAARGSNARYAIAHYQLEIGRSRGDMQMQAQAVDAIVDSGLAQRDELPSLLASQASRAFFANEFQRADRLLGRAIELQPNNAALLADHAQVKARMGDRAQAVALFQRALAAQRTAGQPAPESWYRRAVALAFDGRLVPQGIALGRELVSAYPSPINWRDALLVYRQSAQPDPALNLDILRLARVTQALSGERDYFELAEALGVSTRAGFQPPTGVILAGEAKAALDEGISRGMLDANEPIVRALNTANNPRATRERSGLASLRTQALAAAATGSQARAAADVYFGQGQYAQAAELYMAALQKGGEDANLVNSRLGAALALAGRRAEAETALRAVTGPRADLAGFWLAWLARRTG